MDFGFRTVNYCSVVKSSDFKQRPKSEQLCLDFGKNLCLKSEQMVQTERFLFGPIHKSSNRMIKRTELPERPKSERLKSEHIKVWFSLLAKIRPFGFRHSTVNHTITTRLINRYSSTTMTLLTA